MGKTSISCSEETRDRLKSLKDDQTWDELLIEMADQYNSTTSDDGLEARIERLESRVTEIESMATR